MRFEKVKFSQYCKDLMSKKESLYRFSIGSLCERLYDSEETISNQYNDIKLPKRATKRSAGYDFYAPYDFSVSPGDTICIATGLKIKLDDDKFLLIAPRSGQGFKYRVQLDNTIGVIDADYYGNEGNDGHMFVKLTNDSNRGGVLNVKKGEAMCQAIILPYFITEDDDSDKERIGGFGSTSR